MIEDFEKISSYDYIEWEKLRDRTIFVTGATGLIGKLLVKTVIYVSSEKGLNIKVIALIRNREKAERVFEEEINSKSLIFIEGDVQKLQCIDMPIDYIIHCASVTASKQMVTSPVETFLTMVKGTDNVLRLGQKAGVKGFVYVSSMEMYGNTAIEQNPITEKKYGYVDIMNVRSCYPEGKRAAECLCSAYANEYALPIRIARLAQTFGAGVSDEETRVFASFVKSAIKNEDIVLHTQGNSVGNYCYTADVVGALLCLLTKGDVGEAYNVVNENNSMKIKEMAELIAREISNGKSRVVFDIPEDSLKYGYASDTNLRLSAEKIRKLGWKSEYGLVDMYKRMIVDWK
jgi:nucleoside-diphosphate-sugar epimerase